MRPDSSGSEDSATRRWAGAKYADTSDQDLLRAHVAGDPEAFGALFARHRDRLWAVALRTMGNPHDAADGLQDGLIAAYRRAGSFREDAAVTTWLHRVIVNACLDRLRAAKVRRAEPLPESSEEYHARGARATSDSVGASDPAEAAVASERRRAVLDALASLPVEQRAALVLVDMNGYPIAEAAAILDVAEGTIKSRCSRGRAKLAETLGVLRAEGADTRAGNPRPTTTVRSEEGTRGPPTT
ncbi:MAG: RNA polymerase sigma factor SigM [Nocardioides sp.]